LLLELPSGEGTLNGQQATGKKNNSKFKIQNSKFKIKERPFLQHSCKAAKLPPALCKAAKLPPMQVRSFPLPTDGFESPTKRW
jgi:hypothetical protein